MDPMPPHQPVTRGPFPPPSRPSPTVPERLPRQGLMGRLRAATAPSPHYGLADPATWVSAGSVVASVLFAGLGIAHPSQLLRLGIVVATGVVLGAVALAKHLLSFQQLLGDVVQIIRTWGPGSSAGAERPLIRWPDQGRAGNWVAAHPPTGGVPSAPMDTTDHRAMHLGKLDAKRDPRTLQLARYLRDDMPPPPPSADWTTKVAQWGTMENDRIGDCVFAGYGHAIQLWTAWSAAGGEYTPSDDDVVAAYTAVGHYNPADPSSDRGAVELDALNYFRQVGMAGHKIAAYVDAEPTNHLHVQVAIATFGLAYVGLALPTSAQQQQVWDVVPGDDPSTQPGSWGGHCVIYAAYNATGPVAVTWGQLKQLTWAFHDRYCDEVHVPLSPDWVNAAGSNPVGIAWAALMADLADVTG